jgi:hypothetical protein
MPSNPLNLAELFSQLNKDLNTHLAGSSGMAGVTLRINSYSHLIAAHPENIHDSRNSLIPSTEALMEKINNSITKFATRGGSSHQLLVEAYTRIIVGRTKP